VHYASGNVRGPCQMLTQSAVDGARGRPDRVPSHDGKERDNQMSVAWQKSSFSGVNECVEAARWAGRTLLRSSKDPSGGQLAVTDEEWQTFLFGVRGGGLDP
jgi:hypothetical protein